ncbi:hypothetical protein NDA03_25830 [Trichocoleus sp. Lan]|uniref:hypothetical protein n=1 Tax=Trichocoleus sp. Lan TaxID=2933927 RepID=UPI00329847C7
MNVTISDELNELLGLMSQATGLTKSSLIAEYARRGIVEDAANQEIVLKFKQSLKAQEKKK